MALKPSYSGASLPADPGTPPESARRSWVLGRQVAQTDAPASPLPGDLWLKSDGDAGTDTSPSPRTIAYAAAISIDVQAGSPRCNITLTGNTVLTPTNGVDRVVLRIAALASGAQRTVTIPTAVRLSTGLTSRSFTVPAGEAWLGALEYSTLLGAFVLTAATVSAA